MTQLCCGQVPWMHAFGASSNHRTLKRIQMPCGLFQEATFEPYKSLHKGMVYVDSETAGVTRVKEGKIWISYFLGDPSRRGGRRWIRVAVNSSFLIQLQWHLSLIRPPDWKIGTAWELRTAASIPMPIQYIEMDLRNKTTSEFRAVFDSPLGIPNSQVSLYVNISGRGRDGGISVKCVLYA